MIQQITDVVLTVTAFQMVLLAVIVLRQRDGDRTKIDLFAAFLLSKGFLLLRWFSFRFGILVYEDVPYVYAVTACGFFLLAPLLYQYIRSMCYSDFRLRWIDLAHGLPCAVFVCLAAIRVHLLLNQGDEESVGLTGFVRFRYWSVFWTANLVQVLCYIIAILHTVRGYRHKLKNIYSSVEGIDLRWLMMLVAVIALHWVFVVSRALLGTFRADAVRLIAVMDLFSITIFLVFTTTLVLKGLSQLKVFSGIDAKRRYADSKLSQTDLQKHLEALSHYMEKQKPYLVPSLTIDDLSRNLAIPSWRLSQVINRSFNQNFFNFVNNYRVEEAKKMLTDPKTSRKTILQILLEVGFNSKSSFNNAFKRHTGMTPKEFRKLNHG